MSISRINSNYPTRYEIRRTTRNTSGKDFDNTALRGNKYIKNFADTTRQTSALDIYNRMSKFKGNEGGASTMVTDSEDDERVLSDEELEQTASRESETKTEIIVKPDGSRVLVMTMSVGELETAMSLEISKPTKALNDNSKQDTDNNMPTAENDMLSNEMSNISNED